MNGVAQSGSVSESSAERDFRTFFELSAVGNVVAEAETGMFLRVNRRFCEITGFREDELLRMSSEELTHPDDRARDREGWQTCLARGESHYEVKKRYVRKDGGVIRVDVMSTIVRGAGGAPLHAIGVVRDMTKLHEARDAGRRLAETNRTLATLIDASPLAIVTLDTSLRITTWNSAAERMFGWKEEEVIGGPLPTIPGEHEYLREHRRLLELLVPTHIESVRATKDGRRIEVGIWYAPVYDDDGQLGGHLALLMDVSERKFLERAFLEAGEREQRRIGQELHDHLYQQLLGAAFAAKAIGGELDRKNSETAARAHELAGLLNEAVREARDVSRGLHPVETDASGMMSALEELVHRVRHLANCRFVCAPPVTLSDTATAVHAYRIAQDAVSAAIHQAGAQNIILRLAEDDGVVTLEISDDGAGPNELTERPRGTAAKILEYRARAIGGKVILETRPEGGGRVTCLFPNHHEQQRNENSQGTERG